MYCLLTEPPPFHFGKADSVERTLLRVACQSETFKVPPWQGDASIRFLWHIGCQSEIDEPVSMASRPVDCGSCRRRNFSTSFHLVKGEFGRMGTQLAVIARSKHTPRTGPSFCRNGSLHRSRRWHCPQGVCADSLVFFLLGEGAFRGFAFRTLPRSGEFFKSGSWVDAL